MEAALFQWNFGRSRAPMEARYRPISRTAFAARHFPMTAFQKLVKRVRANSRVCIAVVSVLLVVGGFVLLSQEATRETDARKSPEILEFERTPDAWLANQRNVSELIKAADKG